MTRVMLTGANGHLGANIARSLLQRGYEVVPFVRHTSDLRGLAPLSLTYAFGDVLDGDSVRRAAEGCAVIIHTAAVFRHWARDPQTIARPAVEGTRNVLQAARDAGVRRLVYTSTAWAVGLSADPHELLTAADWNDDPLNPYAAAKTQAEREAWALADALSVPMVSIVPNAVLGPYDFRLTPSMQTLRDWINGRQFTADSGVAYVDVRDVAQIHALAVAEGQPGRRYLVSGPNLTMAEMGRLLRTMTGTGPRYLPFGSGPSAAYAALVEVAARITGGEPSVTRAMARELVNHYMFTDCRETWRAFDYLPRSAEVMVRDAIRWLLFMGELKPSVARALGSEFGPEPEWEIATNRQQITENR